MDKIIAWDQSTDTAISPERAPEHLEWCAEFKGKKVIKRQWHRPSPPEPQTAVPITNINFNGAGLDPDQPSSGRVDLISGMNVEITFNVLLPDNTKLTIPVKNRDTGQLKVIKAKVQAGSVAKTFKFNESGFYVIDSELVNSVGRDGVEFKLDPMLILVQDD